MKNLNFSLLISCALIIALTQSCNKNREEINLKKTAAYFQGINKEKDIAKLNFFFSQMPKGGDLHHHYAGALYAETLLDWIKDNKLFINAQSFMPVNTSGPGAVSVDSLRQNNSLYRALLSAWSTMDFYNHYSTQVAPDQHFFNTFNYFIPYVGNYKAGLAEIKNRAVIENVQYIETMLDMILLPDHVAGYDSVLYGFSKTRSDNGLFEFFAKMQSTINDQAAKAAVNKFNATVNKAHQGIDDSTFTMRYQVYVLRLLNPEAVFNSMHAAFMAAAENKNIVGINVVGAENSLVAMNDYWLHMQMLKYFKSQPQFKNVHLALHAGELAMGMVKPEHLTYHINDALIIAGAERIGHGVDMPYEKNAVALLKYMAKNEKAIEINLTSNEFILGVKNNRHPINLYYDAKVPVIISTDDAGVSRNNLTDQYTLLAERYSFNYAQVKDIVFNSIHYSFLPQNIKDENIKILERRFLAFEKQMASVQE